MAKRPFFADRKPPPHHHKPKPPREANLIVGRVSVHRDGFGFVILDQPSELFEGDLFLPPEAAAKAMHGDRVAARLTRLGRDGRTEGDIVRIIERAHTTIVGRFRVKRRGYFVQPHDERLQQWIHIPSIDSLPSLANRVGDAPAHKIESPEDMDGMVVEAQIIEFPSEGTDAVGRIVEVLGHPDDFGVDVEIIIRKHHIPHRFPPDVLEQARAMPHEISPIDLQGREDFRSYDIVTIDGETARDFDDAVWVDRLPNGHFALHVHIADVSHYIRPGSPIDREAALRGTSVYFPDRAVPMLPVELSTDICSLRPKEDRLVMSALLELDHQGDIVSQRFVRGVIRSVERMTYTHVHALLEGDAALRERYAPLVGRFELMQELALILNRKRHRRGSIDFDLPETEVVLSEFGEIEAIIPSERNVAHRLIEEFMLLANETVASHLVAQNAPALHRVHEAPDLRKVEDFEAFISTLGYSLAAEGRALRPKHFQKLVDRIRGTPVERPIAALMLRTMQKARYDAASLGHFGLAAEHYTHFTSPIRRYPDLVVHRMLRESRQGEIGAQRREELDEELPETARHTSEMERRADDAERELLQWKKVRFMADKVGDEYDGYVVGVAPFGLFVELIDHYVEGLVHISSMADDYYRFVEQHHVLHGENTKKVYRLGDKVTVQVVRVDMERRQVDLGLVDILETVRADARPRGPIRSKVRTKMERKKAGRPGKRERKERLAARGKPPEERRVKGPRRKAR